MYRCELLSERTYHLNSTEKGMILALKQQGRSLEYIAKVMNWSKKTVWRFLSDPEKYFYSNQKGRTPKLNDRTREKICQLASTGNYLILEIKNELKLETSKSTIYSVLS